jgi:hypothetical protein
MVDLFGRPIYDTPRAKQPALFGDRSWFHSGYSDAAHGTYSERTGREQPPYRAGYLAGCRDLDAGCHGEEGERRAWAQNRAVGNVEG